MKARAAEMRSHRRAKFQRRAQEHFLQRFSLRGVIPRPSKLIVKKQRLIFFSAVVVFGGKDFSIPRELPSRIFFLLQKHAEGVALARIGVKIQIVTKNLREMHRELRRFSSLFHGIKKG